MRYDTIAWIPIMMHPFKRSLFLVYILVRIMSTEYGSLLTVSLINLFMDNIRCNT